LILWRQDLSPYDTAERRKEESDQKTNRSW